MTNIDAHKDQQYSNPFDSDVARANSTYAAFRNNKLVRPLHSELPSSPLMQLVHDSFRALVLSSGFSCVGAKAAMNRGDYRFGMYAEMNSPGATAGLARDLFTFVEEQNQLESDFTTFIACFRGPHAASEVDFERHLWAQLQSLHDLDCLHHRWDPSVASHPEHPKFSFSFAGRAFFIVGLSPASSRWTRRFAWPTLIFNAHYQFDRLRELGKYQLIQKAIRSRECTLQGNVSSTLSDFGEISEARQYSGRAVEQEWKCPFSARTSEERIG